MQTFVNLLLAFGKNHRQATELWRVLGTERRNKIEMLEGKPAAERDETITEILDDYKRSGGRMTPIVKRPQGISKAVFALTRCGYSKKDAADLVAGMIAEEIEPLEAAAEDETVDIRQVVSEQLGAYFERLKAAVDADDETLPGDGAGAV